MKNTELKMSKMRLAINMITLIDKMAQEGEDYSLIMRNYNELIEEFDLPLTKIKWISNMEFEFEGLVMTTEEFRETKDYAEKIDKIKNYSKETIFILNYLKNPEANVWQIVMQDCIKKGVVKSVNAEFSWVGERQSETFERL